MNFATLAYALFLLVVVIGYWLMPRRAGRYWLIVASLVFYGSWNPIYVPGFVALVLANWLLGLLAAGPRRRIAILLAVAANLGLLAFFKYASWLLGSSAALVTTVTGEPPPFGAFEIILPLAISFVTFTMLAYVIDTARGARPERDLARFALFVTFFPHLIAGPIMRGRELLPQIRHPRPFAIEHLRMALPFLVTGLLKKTVADNLAPYADQAFADPTGLSTLAAWGGVLAFTFQILFDFSGYTDLALGSAALLGFRLPFNFEWPYRALSLQDFWRRWHMTLSRWLRDYLYFGLGGSRKGPRRTYVALMTTMLLGGLWHGAGLTFILWGAWHGAGLAVHRLHREHLAPRFTMPQVLAWAATFGFVVFGWVLFRAASLEDAVAMMGRMVTVSGGEQVVPVTVVLLCAAMVLGQWRGWATLLRLAAPAGSYRRYLAYGTMLLAAVLLVPVNAAEFIYFQF